MKNCNIILTEKQHRYQHYHLKKLINMNIFYQLNYLSVEEMLPSNQRQIIEEAMFAYSTL